MTAAMNTSPTKPPTRFCVTDPLLPSDSSPSEGNAAQRSATALREAGRDTSIQDDVVSHPVLRGKAHGVLAAEIAPVDRDGVALVPRERGAAERNRDRRALERLLDLS